MYEKVLFLILASFLVLAACGQEESKSEDKKKQNPHQKMIRRKTRIKS